MSTSTALAATRGRRWRRADSLALLTLTVGLLCMVVVGRVVYLRGDDWVLLSIVSSPGFGPADLVEPYGSHLMPFGLAAFWSARALAGPTPWWALVGVGAALTVVGLTFTWLSIRMLVGPRVKAVVPFALAAWAPAIMTAVLWPSPSVYMTPLFAVTGVALWAYLRQQLTPDRGHPQVVIVAAVVLGLGACELVLLVPALLFVIGVSWFGPGGLVVSVKRTWAQARGMWLFLLAVLACYVGLYLVVASYGETLPSQRAQFDVLVESGFLVALKGLPAMIVGGPWAWNNAMGPAGSVTGPAAVLMAGVAWAVIILARRAKRRVWWPVVAALTMTVLALSAARIATFGPQVVLNPYYAVGALAVLAMTLAVGYLPSALPIDRPGREEPSMLVCSVAAGLLLASVAVALGNYSQAVPRSPTRAYLETATASLGQPTLNTASPRDQFGVFLYGSPWDTAQHTFDLVGIPGAWVTVTDDPWMLDGSGRRVPLRVAGQPFALTGSCVPVDGAVAFRLPEVREPNWPTYAMSYQASAGTGGVVEVGDARIEVPLMAGEHTVYFVGDGRPDSFVLRADGICVSSLSVGPAEPAP